MSKYLAMYLCNKLGNVFFSALCMGFFIVAIAEIKNMPCTEKMDFLRIAHMIFFTGVWNSYLHKSQENLTLLKRS
jgi:hypothetical protein